MEGKFRRIMEKNKKVDQSAVMDVLGIIERLKQSGVPPVGYRLDPPFAGGRITKGLARQNLTGRPGGRQRAATPKGKAG